jgi:hypothetical protein
MTQNKNPFQEIFATLATRAIFVGGIMLLFDKISITYLVNGQNNYGCQRYFCKHIFIIFTSKGPFLTKSTHF